MRDDPWTAANRDKEQQKVTIPPNRKPMAETASPPSPIDGIGDFNNNGTADIAFHYDQGLSRTSGDYLVGNYGIVGSQTTAVTGLDWLPG